MSTHILEIVDNIEYLGVVDSQNEMLALEGNRGDWCVRSDLALQPMWMITGDTPTELGSWTAIPYPAIPTLLSQLTGDSTHRTVTDASITNWNASAGSRVPVLNRVAFLSNEFTTDTFPLFKTYATAKAYLLALTPTPDATHPAWLKRYSAADGTLIALGDDTIQTLAALGIIVEDGFAANITAIANLSGSNTGDETATTIGTLINGATAKTTPVDADMVGLMDSEASNVIKKFSWTNVKAALKTYFDSIYSTLTLSAVKSDTDIADAISKKHSNSLDHSHSNKSDLDAATATPGASKIVMSDGSSKVDGWVSDASDTVKGKVELATAAETTTGTDATRAVTPDGLAGSDYGKRLIQIKVVDDNTVLTTGDGKIIFCIPPELNGYNLVAAAAFVSTVSSSGLPTVQLRNVTDSVDMLSTKVSIDANEYTSYTAAAAAVIDTAHDDVATGDLIAVDVDVAGTGTKGLGVILNFQLP